MPQPFLRRIWGETVAVLDRSRRLRLVDLLLVLGIVGLFFGLINLSREWTQELRPTVEIDLSPWALPRYTFFSLTRGLIAYVLSLGFTLTYGYWAAKDRVAERVLVPLLDIFQSIPVLSIMPGLILALVALFPRSNIGLELASILAIFTGQVWNMTFSFYHSLLSVPADQREVATVYRFSWWQRLRWVEIPFSMMGLVWNSMMSMAGGWFFLMINEAVQFGDKDFRLPGLGSYMSVAAEEGRWDAMAWAILAMVTMIVGLDQLLWRPITVWAQKFRVDEGGYQEAMSSWFLDLLRRSHLVDLLGGWIRRQQAKEPPPSPLKLGEKATPAEAAPVGAWVSRLLFAILLLALAYGAWRLLDLLRQVNGTQWLGLFTDAGWTLSRVLAATAIGTLWAVPAGLAIGLSPKLSRILQPVVQVVASFPAPMLFPLVLLILDFLHVSLGWGSIVLMLLGTQWYILFNVIAGAMAIPADLKEAAHCYRLNGWQRFRALYFPAIFAYLVTGWVTAAGGAWNASIVSEYVTFKHEVQATTGLGAAIGAAVAEKPEANYPMLAASVLVMSTVVVLFNRTLWRKCYELAERRFSLNK